MSRTTGWALAGAGLRTGVQTPALNLRLNPCAGGARVRALRSSSPSTRPPVTLPPTAPGLPGLPGLSPGLASFASTGSCTLRSPTSPLSTGVCARPLLAACSAPAPMGRPKASSTRPARKVHAGRLRRGLGRLGPAFPSSCDSLRSAQGPPLCHLRLQPLREHGLREAGSAAARGHGGHGLRGLWHRWHQSHAAGGQPCHRRPGTRAHVGQMPEGPATPGLRTSASPGAAGPAPHTPPRLLGCSPGPQAPLRGTVSLED